jgi:hypothetical protein
VSERSIDAGRRVRLATASPLTGNQAALEAVLAQCTTTTEES